MHDSCNLCQTHGPVFGGVFDVEYVAEPSEDHEPSVAPAPSATSGLHEEEFSDAEFPSDE